MVRTQIQLPDDLYKRVKRFSEEREIPMAEVARRGMELLMDRYPRSSPDPGWKLPVVDGGGLKVSLDKVKDFARDEECRG